MIDRPRRWPVSEAAHIRYTADTWPSDRWPNFSHDELACSHTGICNIDPGLMDELQAMRDAVGEPLYVSSGYRDPSHPLEARKPRPGSHSLGLAVDVTCSGRLAYDVVGLATLQDFTGIGIAQSGPHHSRYVHLDIAPRDNPDRPRPFVWSY